METADRLLADDPRADQPSADDASAAGLAAAKRPAGLAAGSLGQPLHPLVVGLPIGAWVISFAFDLAARTANEELVYARGAFWLIGIGIVGAVAAAVTGLIDLLAIPRGTPVFRTALAHMVLSDVALIAFVISFLARRGDASLTAATAPVLALSVVGLAALGACAWLGVRLAFRYGVRVADERTQAQGYRPRSPEPTDGHDAAADTAEVAS